MDDVRVLIVADDPLARAGLSTLLTSQSGYVIVGQVGWGPEMPSIVDAHRPDVLLWDIGWDASDAEDRLTSVAELNTPVVALVSNNDLAVEAWAAGVRGVLPREIDLQPLLSALSAVANGLAAIEPSLSAGLRPVQGTPSLESLGALTPRELEVLRLLAEGLTNKAIADALHISDHTVKFHLSALFTKLGAQSRTEAVTLATRLGLIYL